LLKMKQNRWFLTDYKMTKCISGMVHFSGHPPGKSRKPEGTDEERHCQECNTPDGFLEIKRITVPMNANDDMMPKNAVDADNKNEMITIINEILMQTVQSRFSK